VDVDAIPNASDAKLQEPGDDASCAWLASGDYVACVGTDGIEKGPTEIPACASTVPPATVSRCRALRPPWCAPTRTRSIASTSPAAHWRTTPRNRRRGADADLHITATGGLVWIDDAVGTGAWVVHRLGINTIDKNDRDAALLDEQGQPVGDGTTGNSGADASGNATGDEQSADDKLDHNDTEDPPIAIADSVTARAGNDITIPVTSNDYDPDGEPIALKSVGGAKAAGHGSTDLIDANTVAYRPAAGFSGTDTFDYTITDPFWQHGYRGGHRAVVPTR
jgi:hypothetical protein